MKKAFIWVSGLSFIDKKKLLMARNLFGFLAKNKPVWVSGKTKNIPGANWLRLQRAWQLFKPAEQGECLPIVCSYWISGASAHQS